MVTQLSCDCGDHRLVNFWGFRCENEVGMMKFSHQSLDHMASRLNTWWGRHSTTKLCKLNAQNKIQKMDKNIQNNKHAWHKFYPLSVCVWHHQDYLRFVLQTEGVYIEIWEFSRQRGSNKIHSRIALWEVNCGIQHVWNLTHIRDKVTISLPLLLKSISCKPSSFLEVQC